MSEDTLLNQPGMQELRKKLLQKTLDYYQRFLKQRADDPTVQDELGMTFYPCRPHRRADRFARQQHADITSRPRAARRTIAWQSPDDPQRLQRPRRHLQRHRRRAQKRAAPDEALKALQKARDIRQQLVAAISTRTRNTRARLPKR